MMRAVSLQSVIDGVAIKHGHDPETLQAVHRAAIVEHVNDRLTFAWDYYPFPEWTRREVRAPVDGVIALAAAGQTPINLVVEVRSSDPTGEHLGLPLDYALDDRGLIVPRQHAHVAVTFTLMPPTFTATAHAPGTYAAGSLVYATGETWRANSTTASVPPSLPWERVPFPYILARAVKTGGAADLLREDGQTDKANAEEEKFLRRLDEAVETVTITQNQRHRYVA
jgi:hypothetical protein